MGAIKKIIIFSGIILLLLVITRFLFKKDDIGDRWDVRRVKTNVIEAAIDTYILHAGKLPNKLEDLIYCPDDLNDVWKGPYLKKSQIYDVWDKPYIYEINQSDPNRYNLISYGKDGKPSGKGYDTDIYND